MHSILIYIYNCYEDLVPYIYKRSGTTTIIGMYKNILSQKPIRAIVRSGI